MSSDDYFGDLINARYGDAASVNVAGEEVRRYDTYIQRIWDHLSTVCSTDADLPPVWTLHSHRALPSLLKVDSEQWLVWDAGLGTLFDWLSLPLHHPQPVAIVEAVIRRLFAVRCVMAGRVQDGASNVMLAEQLLATTPIDRWRQENSDAESRFEDWLITTLQEMFAIGHELAHYLKSVDPESFSDFGTRVIELLSHAANEHQDESSTTSLEGLGYEEKEQRGRGEYVWFRRGWREASSAPPCRKDLRSSARRTLTSLMMSNELMEEVICDFMSAVSVARFAQSQQHGWTGIMAAACSSLALNNLNLILWLDRCAAAGERLEFLPGPERTRLESLEVLLALGLTPVLEGASTGIMPTLVDVEDAVRMASGLFNERVGAAAVAADLFPPIVNQSNEFDANRTLLRATFFLLRGPLT